MLFTGREVRIRKNCIRGLEYGPRPAAEGRTQDRPRTAENVFIIFSLYGIALKATLVLNSNYSRSFQIWRTCALDISGKIKRYCFLGFHNCLTLCRMYNVYVLLYKDWIADSIQWNDPGGML